MATRGGAPRQAMITLTESASTALAFTDATIWRLDGVRLLFDVDGERGDDAVPFHRGRRLGRR